MVLNLSVREMRVSSHSVFDCTGNLSYPDNKLAFCKRNYSLQEWRLLHFLIFLQVATTEPRLQIQRHFCIVFLCCMLLQRVK